MKILLPILFLLSFNLHADDSFKIWGGVFSKTTVNDDFSFWIEDQLRLNGDVLGTNQFLFRTGPLQKINDHHELGYLYAFIKTGLVLEHRFTFQHVQKYSSTMSHRARFELRTFEDLKPKYRARYLFRYNQGKLVVWDELFVSLSPDFEFDRNRLFVGLKSNFNEMRFEYGYLAQSTSETTQHVATIYAFF